MRILFLTCTTIALSFLSNAQSPINIRNISLDSDLQVYNSHEAILAQDSTTLNNPGHKDSNGQTIFVTEEIAKSNIIEISLVSLTLEFDEMMDGKIVIHVSGGMPEYNFSWSHDIDLNSNTASNLSSGNYVVTVTDANGSTASKDFFLGFITNTEDLEPGYSVSINPNPALNRIRIKSEGVEKIEEVRLIDKIGVLIKSWQSIPADSWLELVNIAPGNYFLYFRAEGKSISKKLLIK